MITQIELKNIRIFSSTDWEFNLKPITIFCGTNSAGKSTVLKSLLLLSQSQGIHDANPPLQSKLRFAGSQVDFGDYKSVVSNNEIDRDISISITTSDQLPSWLSATMENIIPNIDKGTDVTYTLKSRFTFESQHQHDVGLDPLEDSPSTGGALKESAFTLILSACVHGQNKEKKFTWHIEQLKARDGISKSYIISMPAELVSHSGIDAVATIRRTRNDNQYIAPVNLRGLLPDALIAKLRHGALSKIQEERRPKHRIPIHLPILIAIPLRDLRSALADIHYLGPLRTPAKRYYVANLEAPSELDSSGDFLPYVLKDKVPQELEYAHPKTWDISATSLTNALNHWLHYLRTGIPDAPTPSSKEIRVSRTKGVLVEFEVKTPSGNGLHSLADSGFGYSQVLPILVRGLLAPTGSTLIIEQPELHLNPALQIRLAEFFIAMMKCGKQVIIETHSEHIVNSIRVLAAEDPSGQVASNSSIYFIDTESQFPVVRDLSIQKDGTVPGWPRQFFGEALSLTSRLLAAQRSKRVPRDGGK